MLFFKHSSIVAIIASSVLPRSVMEAFFHARSVVRLSSGYIGREGKTRTTILPYGLEQHQKKAKSSLVTVQPVTRG